MNAANRYRGSMIRIENGARLWCALAALSMFAGCRATEEGPVRHRFLALGGETRIVEEDGTVSWRYPLATRDGQVLENGNVLLAVSKCERYPGGAVVELAPDGRMVLEHRGTQSEVNTAQRLPGGGTMLTEAGDKPRILVLDADGAVVRETAIACQTANHHMESRMARMLPDGNCLVPQLLDRVVREYRPDGTIASEWKSPDDPADAWPFTAIRLEDGGTLVTLTHANMVVELDRSGKIVWQLSNADLPQPLLADPCGAQRLPDGNTVVCSYAIGAERTKLVEVDRAKRVVWTWREADGPGIHEVHVLTTNGRSLGTKPLR